MSKNFPKLIYVTRQGEGEDECLLVWDSLEDAEVGMVGVYRLEEAIEKREVAEIRRQGTKGWFKP